MSISRKLKNAASESSSGGGGGGTYVDDVFSTYLYKGKGSTQDIVNGIDLAGEGGMVWVKARTGNYSHSLQDTENGPLNYLMSNATSAIAANPNGLQSFNSDGFSWGTHLSGEKVVSWTFRKAPNFFDVVTYRGNNSTPVTVPHNLGVEPGMIIIKSSDTAGDWYVYHKGFTFPNWCALNSTDAQGTAKGAGLTAPPTAESFTVSNGSGVVGADQEYVAYVFAHDDSDESMIKCGSYAGTGSPQSIDLGFEPQFILQRSSSATDSWKMLDNMRGVVVGSEDAQLVAEDSPAESKAIDRFSFTPTGFEATTTESIAGREYIYMAIRRPNKPAEEFDPEELFESSGKGSAGDSKAPAYRSDFPADFAIELNKYGSEPTSVSRLTSAKKIDTSSNQAEANYSDSMWDYQNGWNSSTSASSSNLSHIWHRAPGFFDVVCYEGDGQDPRGISHNLGVEPEMIWSKCRSVTQDWFVHVKGVTTKHDHLKLNEPNKIINGSAFWDGHNEDQFFVQGLQTNWSGQTHITYLFASVPGISKVGSYTGNGAEQDIDCGFTNGARFVLIKCASNTGDWSVYDSLRGITESSSPALYLNRASSQATGDRIKPFSKGFTVTQSQPINGLSETYIFYAIA